MVTSNNATKWSIRLKGLDFGAPTLGFTGIEEKVDTAVLGINRAHLDIQVVATTNGKFISSTSNVKQIVSDTMCSRVVRDSVGVTGELLV